MKRFILLAAPLTALVLCGCVVTSGYVAYEQPYYVRPYYDRPPPVYYAPPPRVYYAPPPAVIIAPPPRPYPHRHWR